MSTRCARKTQTSSCTQVHVISKFNNQKGIATRHYLTIWPVLICNIEEKTSNYSSKKSLWKFKIERLINREKDNNKKIKNKIINTNNNKMSELANQQKGGKKKNKLASLASKFETAKNTAKARQKACNRREYGNDKEGISREQKCAKQKLKLQRTSQKAKKIQAKGMSPVLTPQSIKSVVTPRKHQKDKKKTTMEEVLILRFLQKKRR
ncbi:hypothetical protein RFI_27814, partial [Reticulomyxa filosa]